MYRGSGPRIFPLIIIILVVALVIAALVSVGRIFFTGGGSTSAPDSTESILSAVHDTSDGRAVRWTVRGPIVADEKFRSYQIEVTPNERSYTTYAGYLDQAIDTKTYPNNTRAYEQFVYALDKAGIGQTRNANDADYRGACATNGFVFVFDTLNGGTAEHTLWTSSCSGSKGSMAANVSQIHALFTNQIPDFKPLFTTTY